MTVTIVYVLLAAHFIGDFILQSDWMALNKSKRWDALALHVGVYSATLFLCAAPFSRPEFHWFWYFVTCNAAAHFVQDAITSRMTTRLFPWRPAHLSDFPIRFYDEAAKEFDGRRWGGDRWFMVPSETGNRHWFFVTIGADQLLHYLTLFITAQWWLL